MVRKAEGVVLASGVVAMVLVAGCVGIRPNAVGAKPDKIGVSTLPPKTRGSARFVDNPSPEAKELAGRDVTEHVVPALDGSGNKARGGSVSRGPNVADGYYKWMPRRLIFGVLMLPDGHHSSVRKSVVEQTDKSWDAWENGRNVKTHTVGGSHYLRLDRDQFAAFWYLDFYSGEWGYWTVHGKQHKHWLPVYSPDGSWAYLKNGTTSAITCKGPGFTLRFDNPHDSGGWRVCDVIYRFKQSPTRVKRY
jgi:hypothetical protein